MVAATPGHLLRERYRYIGELRAVGDAARPDLPDVTRRLSPHLRARRPNVEKALAAFNDFSAYYQHAADRL